MLKLSKISITHFKNYEFKIFSFSARVIGIYGLNGKGKTNLLDAIYYCCFTKSYFIATDNMNIGFDKDGFRLEALFHHDDSSNKIICINRGTGKKELSLNDVPYEKLSSHIGLLPSVIIAPDDIELIAGNSDLRRKYIDTILCQIDSDYLQQLMKYNKILQQRNSLLKRFAEQGNMDEVLLDIISQQMVEPGTYIFQKRKNLLKEIAPIAKDLYHRFSRNTESITMIYESRLLQNDFNEIFTQNRSKDLLLQRTNGGIHKDDLKFELNGQAFKNTASQGQRKSLLFALKLAEFSILEKYKGFPPILLLDDVFEKLDSERMEQLLAWVCNENTGQVFITDTHRTRLKDTLTHLNTDFQLVELN